MEKTIEFTRLFMSFSVASLFSGSGRKAFNAKPTQYAESLTLISFPLKNGIALSFLAIGFPGTCRAIVYSGVGIVHIGTNPYTSLIISNLRDKVSTDKSPSPRPLQWLLLFHGTS